MIQCTAQWLTFNFSPFHIALFSHFLLPILKLLPSSRLMEKRQEVTPMGMGKLDLALHASCTILTTFFSHRFAFWLTEERAQTGPVFGSKDYFTGLGIMFDTFANARHVSTKAHFSALFFLFIDRGSSLCASAIYISSNHGSQFEWGRKLPSRQGWSQSGIGRMLC